MREILFRGLDIRGIWHEGLLAHVGNAWYISNSAGIATAFEVIPASIGQFTGLYDKNGKRIFEGDICQIKDISYIDDTPFVVEWNNEYSGWFWRDIASADALTPDIANMAKAIGNIHDNPELLKGGEGDG